MESEPNLDKELIAFQEERVREIHAREVVARAGSYLAASGIPVSFIMENGENFYGNHPELDDSGVNSTEELGEVYQEFGRRLDELTSNTADLYRLMMLIELVKAQRQKYPGNDPNAKKRLQAELMVRGKAKPWLEVVDQELEGESLQDSDIDIIAEAFRTESDRQLVRVASQAEGMLMFENTINLFNSRLQGQGVDTDNLTLEETAALNQLVLLHFTAINSQEFFPNRTLSVQVEIACEQLLNLGITDSRWNQVIDELFNT